MTSEPRRLGWFDYAWRVAAVLLLLAGIGQIVSRQIDQYGKRAEVGKWIAESGGSCDLGANGQTQIELPAGRFSRDEIRQIYQVFPTADIALRGP